MTIEMPQTVLRTAFDRNAVNRVRKRGWILSVPDCSRLLSKFQRKSFNSKVFLLIFVLVIGLQQRR